MSHANDETNSWSTEWDLLALGHCGAGFLGLPDSKYIFIDDTTPNSPGNSSQLRDPGRETPESGRLVYPTSGEVCTYAYAVTNPGAAKGFSLLADVDGPWDLQLGDLCKEAQIRCYALAPEPFHHQRWTWQC